LAETLASLIDKLCTANGKLYHIQEMLNSAVKEGEGLDATTTARLHTLNQQRSQLMNEINVLFSRSIEEGEVNIDPVVKLY
jgi:hypothetical protein